MLLYIYETKQRQYECNTCFNDESRRFDVKLYINNLIPWDIGRQNVNLHPHNDTYLNSIILHT
jgi:hypothetical protein